MKAFHSKLQNLRNKSRMILMLKILKSKLCKMTIKRSFWLLRLRRINTGTRSRTTKSSSKKKDRWKKSWESSKTTLKKRQRTSLLRSTRRKETRSRPLKSWEKRCSTRSRRPRLTFLPWMTSSYKLRQDLPFCKISSLPQSWSISQNRPSSFF